MTTEDQDTLYGRFTRELKKAELELHDAKRRATEAARELSALAAEITDRIERANEAGPVGATGFVRADAGIESIERYAGIADTECIRKLDFEIGKALSEVQRLRKEQERYAP